MVEPILSDRMFILVSLILATIVLVTSWIIVKRMPKGLKRTREGEEK